MKGIILAGGEGTRLYPLTIVTSKQLLPIYDKPMIYYSLSTLMLAGIRDILLISTPTDLPNFKRLLGDGSHFGINLSYEIQPSPNGLADAFIIGESFIGNEASALILGDNIFYGNDFSNILRKATYFAENKNTATTLGYFVQDASRFGIASFDTNGKILAIEEKPTNPKSNYAITGLYFYPPGVSKLAKKILPSSRGELEITSLNNIYIANHQLQIELLGRGFAWFDIGTIDSYAKASDFVRMIEKNQGIQISAPEEIAFRQGWITKSELISSAEKYQNSPYGDHLRLVASGALASTLGKIESVLNTSIDSNF